MDRVTDDAVGELKWSNLGMWLGSLVNSELWMVETETDNDSQKLKVFIRLRWVGSQKLDLFYCFS